MAPVRCLNITKNTECRNLQVFYKHRNYFSPFKLIYIIDKMVNMYNLKYNIIRLVISCHIMLYFIRRLDVLYATLIQKSFVDIFVFKFSRGVNNVNAVINLISLHCQVTIYVHVNYQLFKRQYR